MGDGAPSRSESTERARGRPDGTPPERAAPPRRLWLVRHGETLGRSSERYWGSTDVELSEEGREQVRRTAARLLRAEVFEALLFSPLARARASADVVLAELATPPATFAAVDALREVCFGELEGKTAAEIRAERPDWYRRWRAGEIDGYPGGDSIDGFFARVAAGIAAVLTRHPGDLCLVVHRGVVKAALAHLLRLPRATLVPWPLALGSLTVLVEAPGAWHLERYNVEG